MDELETLKGKVYGLTILVGQMARVLADSASQAGDDTGRVKLLTGIEDPLSRLPADIRGAARRGAPFINGFLEVHRDLSGIISGD